MHVGTKIFLAVFTVVIGALVVYYGGFWGDDASPDGAAGEVVSAADETRDIATDPAGPGAGTGRPRQLPPPVEITSPALPRHEETLSPSQAEDAADEGDRDTSARADRGSGSGESPSGTAGVADPPASGAGGAAAPPIGPPAPEGDEAAAPEPAPGARTERSGETTPWVVEKYDTFSSIALEWFGDEQKWSLIAQANPDVDPRSMVPGQVLRLPPRNAELGDAIGGERTIYIVRSGDTLARISGRVLGDPARWRVIYEANRAVIGADPNALDVGMRLRIPEP
jgi:nucleoid-associated protein YgaU